MVKNSNNSNYYYKSFSSAQAKEKGFPIKQFPADWKKHGKAAGPKRNQQMANYADALVAFWDGKSRGTKNMIELANRRKLNILIFYY